MSATVQVAEYNGAEQTKTANITNSNMGDSDSANMTAANYPITPGENSYEKWQKIEVTNMGGSSKVKNLKIWYSGTLGGSASFKSNVRVADYGGAESYAQPVKTDSSVADQTMPSSEPATPNLGIGGSLTGEMTVPGLSDYLVMQIQTDAEDTAGATVTMHYKYTEIV
jgi:hypothetical protein